MSIRRFFHQTDQGSHLPLYKLEIGTNLLLSPDVFHHWCRVLRANVGDSGILFDGYGAESLVTLKDITKKTACVSIVEHTAVSRSIDYRISIALVMSRGDRTDYAIQKSTELGVTHIQLLSSQYGEVHLKATQVNKKLQHWQQVAISACEQCGLNYPPLIHAPLKLNNWLQGESGNVVDNLDPLLAQDYYNSHIPQSTNKNLLEPTIDSNTVKPVKLILAVPRAANLNTMQVHQNIMEKMRLASMTSDRLDIRVLVGPEGGFSNLEYQTAIDACFTPWQLGNRILRAETAPVVALSTLQTLCEFA